MPWLRDGDDRVLATSIERWTEEARSQIDEISGWRENPREKPYFNCPFQLSKQFRMDTAYLMAQITAHFPHLDPTPIQRVYQAAAAWNGDGSSGRLPEQFVLDELLDNAILVLGAVVHRIISRTVKAEPKAVPTKRQPAPECPKCGKKTKITSTGKRSRHWKCDKCRTTGKQSRVTDGAL